MGVQVGVQYRKSFLTPKPIASVFAYCAQLESAVPAHFPALETFECTSPDHYLWTFKKIEYGGSSFQIVLSTKIVAVSTHQIRIENVPGKGTSEIKGGWQFAAKNEGTEVTFDVDLKTELNLPFFLKAVVGPLAQKEMAKIFDKYLSRLEAHCATFTP